MKHGTSVAMSYTQLLDSNVASHSTTAHLTCEFCTDIQVVHGSPRGFLIVLDASGVGDV